MLEADWIMGSETILTGVKTRRAEQAALHERGVQRLIPSPLSLSLSCGSLAASRAVRPPVTTAPR